MVIGNKIIIYDWIVRVCSINIYCDIIDEMVMIIRYWFISSFVIFVIVCIFIMGIKIV